MLVPEIDARTSRLAGGCAQQSLNPLEPPLNVQQLHLVDVAASDHGQFEGSWALLPRQYWRGPLWARVTARRPTPCVPCLPGRLPRYVLPRSPGTYNRVHRVGRGRMHGVRSRRELLGRRVARDRLALRSAVALLRHSCSMATSIQVAHMIRCVSTAIPGRRFPSMTSSSRCAVRQAANSRISIFLSSSDEAAARPSSYCSSRSLRRSSRSTQARRSCSIRDS